MIEQHISRQFHNAWADTEFGPMAINIPKPSLAEINSIAEILANAKKPLLIMGSQSTLPPVKPEQLVQTLNVNNIQALRNIPFK
jgi:acetolactate synthase-like protein